MVNEPIPEGVVTTGLQEAPQVRCEIDHVYGFSGERRSCLYFGRDNEEIVYMAAAIGVVQDLKTRQQRLFGGAQKGKTMKNRQCRLVERTSRRGQSCQERAQDRAAACAGNAPGCGALRGMARRIESESDRIVRGR